MQEFYIHFNEERIEELRGRICNTRLPGLSLNGDWSLGTDSNYLSDLLDYWCNFYDWRCKEQELNGFPQYTCELDGMTVHFFHIRSKRSGAPTLLLTHGWPDSFLRYAKVFPLLSDFNLVVPSLPGFAFSTLPPKGYMNNAETAELWHKLMTEILGYQKYAASGGDMGRGVTCYLASRYPNEVKGILLTDVGMAADLVNAPDEKLSEAEVEYKRKALEWQRKEGAYISLNSTKPQTLAFSLSDSPAGMAAYIAEKYHAWSDWELLTMDDLCDCLTLYWLTNTAGTAIRAYYGNSFTLPPLGKIRVPTAIAAFPPRRSTRSPRVDRAELPGNYVHRNVSWRSLHGTGAAEGFCGKLINLYENGILSLPIERAIQSTHPIQNVVGVFSCTPKGLI